LFEADKPDTKSRAAFKTAIRLFLFLAIHYPAGRRVKLRPELWANSRKTYGSIMEACNILSCCGS
jgi:hypothetical protein